MATDENGYFLNGTGKTMQELVQGTREEYNGYPPLVRVTKYFIKGKGWVKGIAVNFISPEDGGASYTLTEKDLADIDPDEPILLANGHRERLGGTAVYKRALKKYVATKTKERADEQQLSTNNLRDMFGNWKVEPSAEPINDITDIFKDNYK